MLTSEQRIAVIDRQIAEWQEVGYAAEIAAKVHLRIGSAPEQIKTFTDRAIAAEKALHTLGELRAEVAAT